MLLWSLVALILAFLIGPLTTLISCSKKKQPPGTTNSATAASNNGGGLKSKRCNKSTGLGNDDPDLIKSDKAAVTTGDGTNKPGADKGNEAHSPAQPPTDASKVGAVGKTKPTPSREQTLVSKEQCDTDLRSFLSENQKKPGEKGGHKKDVDKADKADKPPSLAATQEGMSKEVVGKKGDGKDKKEKSKSKERHNKANNKVDATQNESVKSVEKEAKNDPAAATAVPAPPQSNKEEKPKSAMSGVGETKIASEHPMPGVPCTEGAASKYMGP